MDLSGKVAVVTGASSGIGRAASIELARCGADVAALDIDEQRMTEVVEHIREAGRRVLPLDVDIAVPERVAWAMERVAGELGRIDIVFANAGINGKWAPIEELTAADWDKTMQANLRGTFLTIKHAVPHLKKRGGSVIVTSSVNGTRMFSNTGASIYAASKAGQVALAKMLALELANEKVRVNVICPGSIATNIDERTRRQDLEGLRPKVEFPEGTVPLTHGRPGTPEQVARLVAFLASDDASHISGTEVWIDGAQSLFQG